MLRSSLFCKGLEAMHVLVKCVDHIWKFVLMCASYCLLQVFDSVFEMSRVYIGKLPFKWMWSLNLNTQCSLTLSHAKQLETAC